MFKDRSQKVWEFVQSTAETEEAEELEVAKEETTAPKKKTEKPKKKDTKKVPAAAKPKKISTKSEKKLDEDKPKRAISAYLFYASERRPILKKECPEMGFGELTHQIAGEWRMMKEKDRKKYNTLAAADKKRYEDEKEQWMSKIDQ